jgi:hypothetical protein
MTLNEVRKTVAHEIGHGMHMSHRPLDPPNTPAQNQSQCPDSAVLGNAVSVMNNNLQLNGQDASFAGSQHNVADIRQIRLHLRQNAQ